MDTGLHQRTPWTPERIQAAYRRAMVRVWKANDALARATGRADRVAAFMPRLEAVRMLLALRKAAGII